MRNKVQMCVEIEGKEDDSDVRASTEGILRCCIFIYTISSLYLDMLG